MPEGGKMMNDRSVELIAPRLLRRDNGGWLAVAPKGAPFRIGVAAWSAEDARRRFEREMAEWVALAGNQDSQDK